MEGKDIVRVQSTDIEPTIDESFKMPDLSLFDDMPNFKPRLERLFDKFNSDENFREIVRRHAQHGLNMDRNMKVADPKMNPDGSFDLGMTMDEFRTWSIFEYTGGKLTNMIKALQEHIDGAVSIFDGTNIPGEPPSFEELMDTEDYDNVQMMQMIRYLRVLPVYKQMLDILTEIRDKRNATYKVINGLIEKAWEDGEGNALNSQETRQLKNLETSVNTDVVAELMQRLSGKKIGTSEPKMIEDK